MKKIILATLASTLIASSASAEGFCVSAHIGGDVGSFFDTPEVKNSMTDVALERQLNLKGGLEVGYRVMDNLSLGLAFGGYLNPEYKLADDKMVTKEAFLKGAGSEDIAKDEFFKTNGVKALESHKFYAASAMAHARFDLVDLDVVQVYVQGGAGLARLSEEMTVSVAKVDAVESKAKVEAVVANPNATPPVAAKAEEAAVVGHAAFEEVKSITVSTESANNFAWSLGAGVAFKLSEEMSLNIGAEYADLGETSNKLDEADSADAKNAVKYGFAGKTKFSAVNLVAGVRFCF